MRVLRKAGKTQSGKPGRRVLRKARKIWRGNPDESGQGGRRA